MLNIVIARPYVSETAGALFMSSAPRWSHCMGAVIGNILDLAANGSSFSSVSCISKFLSLMVWTSGAWLALI
jgi:hypothetical protein